MIVANSHNGRVRLLDQFFGPAFDNLPAWAIYLLIRSSVLSENN